MAFALKVLVHDFGGLLIFGFQYGRLVAAENPRTLHGLPYIFGTEMESLRDKLRIGVSTTF